jgi:hypothetical protein
MVKGTFISDVSFVDEIFEQPVSRFRIGKRRYIIFSGGSLSLSGFILDLREATFMGLGNHFNLNLNHIRRVGKRYETTLYF